MSQATFALALNVSTVLISKWGRGEVRPSGPSLKLLTLAEKKGIEDAKVADLVRHGARFGSITGPASVDMKRVLARKREMVEGLIATHLELYKASGAELMMGTGRFVAPKTLEVDFNDGGKRLLTGDRVVLNLGTHATIPDVPGLAAAKPM